MISYIEPLRSPQSGHNHVIMKKVVTILFRLLQDCPQTRADFVFIVKKPAVLLRGFTYTNYIYR